MKGLGKFDPDRPAAHDDQVFRQRIHAKDGFVGEIGPVGQAGNRRHHRCRAGGDHDASRRHPEIAAFDGPGADEPGRRLDHSHAQAFKALNGIHRGDRIDHAPDMRLHRLEIHDLGFRGNAEPRITLLARPRLAGGQQRL